MTIIDKGTMNSYRDLIVWQKSMYLVKMVYLLTNQLPKDEQYSLTSQLKRSAISVASNIAEGYGRQHKREYIHFLQISRGSLFELQTQLEIAVMVGYLNTDQLTEVNEIGVEIEKMLNSLIKKLSNSK
jgi:four helix bundle protein